MPTRPFHWQREGYVAWTQFNNRILLSWSMGLGKSFGAMLCAHRNPDMRPIVVVCPPSLKMNWARDIAEHFDMSSEILETMTPPKQGFQGHHPLVIIGYNILKPWMPWLKALKPKLIIADECQAYKEMHSLRSRQFRILCTGVPNLIFLSGTPMLNRHRELFNVCNILKPEVPEFRNFSCFAHEFCVARMTPWGTNHDRSKRSLEFNQLLRQHIMHRVTKEQVLKDLPPKRHIMVSLPITDWDEYHEASTNFIEWLSQYSTVKARQAAKAQSLAKIIYLLQLVARLKMKSVVDWIDNYFEETDDKLAIGVVHHATTDALQERYNGTSLTIDGRVNPNKRLGILDQFHSDKRIRLLIGNLQAAGAGLNFKIPTVAVAEYPWTPGELDQFVNRHHGVGRGVEGRTSTAYFLTAGGTIEERLCQCIQDKAKVLAAALDGKQDAEEFDLMDMLVEEMAKESGLLAPKQLECAQ